MAPRSTVFNGPLARQIREDLNLTVNELAGRVTAIIGPNPRTGRPWHPDTFRNVELGHTQPGLKLSHGWAEALGVSRDRLLDPAAPERAVDVQVVTQTEPA